MVDVNLDHDREESGDIPPARLVDRFLQETLAGTVTDFESRTQDLGDDAGLDRMYARVKELRRLRRAVDVMAQGGAVEEPEPLYLLSTSFLADTYKALTKTPDEHLVYATGPEDKKRVFAVTRLVTFALADKSRAHAVPDPKSQTEALVELDRRGERLLAMFHSHPGYGAPGPSPTDLNTQGNLERMRFPTIGAVFSRNGFVRFYSVNRSFRVVVSGTGCERLEDCLFRLTDAAPRSILQKVVGFVTRT
jgi:proteasome lid subunit RPN8/RPN11